MKTLPPNNAQTPDSELPLVFFWQQSPNKPDRLTRIQQLIEKIQRKDGFNASEMRAALGATAWRAFQEQTRSSPIPKEVAKLLRPYQEALRRADALNRQPARALPSPLQKFKMGRHGAQSAEREYERALEWLQCLFDDTPGVGRWFDRSVRFGAPDEPTPDAEGMPRVRGSRSPYALPNLNREELDSAALAALFAALKACKTVNSASSLAWLLPLDEQADADFASPAQKKLDWLL